MPSKAFTSPVKKKMGTFLYCSGDVKIPIILSGARLLSHRWKYISPIFDSGKAETGEIITPPRLGQVE